MKKLIFVFLMLSVLFLSACSAPDSSVNSTPSAIDIPDTSRVDSISQTEPEESPESENSAEECTVKTSDAAAVSDRDESTPEVTGMADAKVPGANQNDSDKVSITDPLPSQSSSNGNSSESSTPKSKPADSTQKEENPKAETTQPPAEETTPKAPNAGAADTSAVAQRVLEYINQYRSSPATRLSGLTEYAQYRSRQLVSNFAHDTADQRAAATALQYGEYVDPSLFGGSGQPYYTANAREAIAKAGYTGTVDEVALSLATLVRNSANHWNYIGDPEYCFIAVGITYDSGMWYCAITVASENTDEY